MKYNTSIHTHITYICIQLLCAFSLVPQDTSRYCTRCGESRNADEEREARAAAAEARKQNLKWECSAAVQRLVGGDWNI